jgi:hypothetical protein
MKIALCLYGLIGSKYTGKSYDKLGGEDEVLTACYESFYNNLICNGNVDVFFHTWDVNFEEKLVSKYKPKLHKVEPQIVFKDVVRGDHNRVQAHYSRWYSTQQVNNLKQQYESENGFKYDMVIMSRFDMIWTTPIKIDNYNSDIFYIPKTSKRGKPWGWPHNNLNEIGDLWYISGSDNMDKFTMLYDKINDYMKNGCPRWNGISNHMLAKYHLQKLSLLPHKVEFAFDDMRNNIGDFLLYRSFIKMKK